MSLYLENSDGVKSMSAWNENVSRQCPLADFSNQKKRSRERRAQSDGWREAEWTVFSAEELRASWAEGTEQAPSLHRRDGSLSSGHFTIATNLETQLFAHSLSYHTHEGTNVGFTEISKFLPKWSIIKVGAGFSPTPLLPSCTWFLFQTCSCSPNSLALPFLSLHDALYLLGTLPPRTLSIDAVWHWMRPAIQDKPFPFQVNQCVVWCS